MAHSIFNFRRLAVALPGWLGCVVLTLVVGVSVSAEPAPASAPASATAPAPTEKPPGVVVYKQVGAIALHLQIFSPDHDRAGSLPRPAIVFFHGGGWKGGTPEQFAPFARYFVSRGMVGISAEYRLKLAHGATPFDATADARSAMRWVRAHAKEFGIDPAKLVAAGGSAGGQLSVATVFATTLDDRADDLAVSPRPQALVLYNPVLDAGPGGTGYELVGERYREFSPLHNVSRGLPPTVIFQGTGDKVVKFAAAQRFTELMRAAGGRCELHLYPDQPHGFYIFKPEGNPYYQRVIVETDRFLRSLAFISGEPTMPDQAVPTL